MGTCYVRGICWQAKEQTRNKNQSISILCFKSASMMSQDEKNVHRLEKRARNEWILLNRDEETVKKWKLKTKQFRSDYIFYILQNYFVTRKNLRAEKENSMS